MKNIFTLVFVLSLLNIGNAQFVERCRSGSIAKKAIENNPAIAEKRAKTQLAISKWIKENPATARMEITLPIVVHVLYFDESENISDEQIQSQIEVLNEDFNGLNINFNDTPDAFKPLRGTVGIRFCLASIDPQGNPTSGITRKKVTESEIGETNSFYSTQNGGTDAWDNSRYINIWIANQEEGSLGFATLPGTADPPESDGIVIPASFFGKTGTAANSTPNDLGRTGTHEMGHYLGLEHIWGTGENGCDTDDNIEDTPNQFTESSECNNFPYFDDCTDTGNGIMFMNFMDYSDDACMTMFSAGQASVMQAIVDTERAGLMNAGITACEAISTNIQEINSSTLKIYPNPTSEYFQIQLTDNSILHNSRLEVFNIKGSLQLLNVQISDNEIDISSLSNGIYVVKIISDEEIHTSKLIVKR